MPWRLQWLEQCNYSKSSNASMWFCLLLFLFYFLERMLFVKAKCFHYRLILNSPGLLLSQLSSIPKYPSLHVLQMLRFSFLHQHLCLMVSCLVIHLFSHLYHLGELVQDTNLFTDPMTSLNRYSNDDFKRYYFRCLSIEVTK